MLVKIEVEYEKGEGFKPWSSHAYSLPWHGVSEDRKPALLAPGMSLTVSLAYWREDLDVILPDIGGIEPYYDEHCENATRFRFSVIGIEDGGEYVSQDFELENPFATGRGTFDLADLEMVCCLKAPSGPEAPAGGQPREPTPVTSS